jgi:hypothetical protein
MMYSSHSLDIVVPAKFNEAFTSNEANLLDDLTGCSNPKVQVPHRE